MSELAGQTRQYAKTCNSLKEHLHGNPSHSSGGVYIILEMCQFEDVVELVLPNTRSGRIVLSNWKVSLDLLRVAYSQLCE